jgi:hypothetical protein
MKSFEPFDGMIRALRARPGHAFLVEWAASHEARGLEAVRAGLLCPTGGDPCGACPACVGPDHPDWIVARGAERIRREEVLDWPSRALVPPVQGRVKVFVVPAAERLTPEAGNLLLKLLEEPPLHVVLVLTTDRPHDVMPTLRSRCRPLRGPTDEDVPAPPDDLAALLQGDFGTTDWVDKLPELGRALRTALRDPGRIPALAGEHPDRLVERWQAVVEAAIALEENANRDLVRRRLERRFRGRPA